MLGAWSKQSYKGFNWKKDHVTQLSAKLRRKTKAYLPQICVPLNDSQWIHSTLNKAASWPPISCKVTYITLKWLSIHVFTIIAQERKRKANIPKTTSAISSLEIDWVISPLKVIVKTVYYEQTLTSDIKTCNSLNFWNNSLIAAWPTNSYGTVVA